MARTVTQHAAERTRSARDSKAALEHWETNGSRPGRGPFAKAYSRGITEELPAPTRRRRALPPAPFALHGAVITSDGAWSSGYVTVANGLIDRVSKRKPTDVAVHETDGVILPGLLDLHGHPEFNVFAAWEPPKLYANRYAWRRSAPYHSLVRDPQNVLLTRVPAKTQTRYAEVRAVVGGVTGIQGASGASSASSEPLVRNIDQWAFGAHRARAMIDLPSGSFGLPTFQRVMDRIKAGDVNAFYLHLSEGRRGDAVSAKEFQRFLDLGAATPATNIIHGSALSVDDLHTVAAAGCRLVWSPQSNLRLYGETTLAGEAIAAGMPVALGADWLPSGSTSLLGEMKVARRELARQGHPIAAADLVAMVTSVAARLTGLDDHLGSVAVGRPADLVVLERHHFDPYENVCLADPSWVELVCIGGDITYGRADWFGALSGGAQGTTIEDLTAWGKPMRLDTGFQGGSDVPSLSTVRGLLTAAYPAVGPIFA
jgi:cytosine/adenosine deaminase-related metal-dependent hydrolase